MLTHEWRELETLCDQIATLRERLTSARKSKNMGLIIGLQDDLTKARRHREQLVQHISARLGTVTAHQEGMPETDAAGQAADPSGQHAGADRPSPPPRGHDQQSSRSSPRAAAEP